MMIPEEIVQQILETAVAEDVVGEYVSLKKRGSNLIGLCPFHSEKTPSFTVSPSRNIFKCFGCGKGGNSVRFLMEHEQFSFPEAVRVLGKKYNIAIPEVDNDEARERRDLLDHLYFANEFAQKHFEDNLWNSEEGKNIGLTYFKERGFRENIIKKFGLGFAVERKTDLTDKVKAEGHNSEYFEQVSLINTRYDKPIDFFRARVMFPIHSLSGRVIAFGGRTLSSEKKIPKYVNSPETTIYNKSRTLYGLHLASRAIRKENNCFLVEGYTDVISMHQAGIENVVASSGTSLTEDQTKLLKRYSAFVTILFDGDAAGMKASMRGVDLLLAQDLNVKIAALPEGEDPDSFVQKKGNAGFKEWVEKEAKDFIFFKAGLLSKEADGDPLKKVDIIKSMVVSLSKIPDPIKRSLYIRECAKIIDIEERIIVNETNKIKRNSLKKHFDKPPESEEFDPLIEKVKMAERQINVEGLKQENVLALEREIIRFLMLYSHYPMDEEETVLEYFINNLKASSIGLETDVYAPIMSLFVKAFNGELKLDSEYFMNHEDDQINQLGIDLMFSKFEISINWLDKHKIVVKNEADLFKESAENILNRFMLKKVIDKMQENQLRMKETDPMAEQQLEFVTVEKKLLGFKIELCEKLGLVTNPLN